MTPAGELTGEVTGELKDELTDEVTVEVEGGPCFTVAPGEDSLLRGALRAGVAFPYECSVGGCGACRFDLLDGDMATLWAAAPGLSERDRRRGKRLACQSRPRSDCRIRVRLEGGGGAPPLPPPLPPRRCRATLVARRAITPDLSEFTFRLPHVAPFRAGQYALLHLPGVEGVRAYSMSERHDPHEDDGRLWRMVVRRLPAGQGSRTLFDAVRLGDAIDLDGPYGHAWLRGAEHGSTRDVVCVAGGSGLGPMLSVARGVLAEPGARRVHFFLGLRTQAELGAAAEVVQLMTTAGRDRLRLDTVLSHPLAGIAWGGATGFVHAHAEAALAALGRPFDAYDHYFAGPPPMVEAVQEMLMVRHRVPFGQIHFDRFV